MPQSHSASLQEERRREEVWRAQVAEVSRIANERFHEIAALIDLGPKETEAFVSTAMEVTRQYQTAYMYANYEKRTGHPYPDEGRDNEEVVWDANWERATSWLRTTLGK